MQNTRLIYTQFFFVSIFFISLVITTTTYNRYNITAIADLLTLYPVFTLTTNYPLIAITLRNNLFLLVPDTWGSARVRHVVLSLLSSGIPIIIAYGTSNVSLLVSYTGSYAGLGIQLVIPALLVYYSRKVLPYFSFVFLILILP